MSENKDSPKDVQSSLGAHTTMNKASALRHVDFEPKELNKGSQKSPDKMSYLSHKQGKRMEDVTSSGQVAEMATCSPWSQTDVIFVAMDALVRIYEDDLTAKRDVAAM